MRLVQHHEIWNPFHSVGAGRSFKKNLLQFHKVLDDQLLGFFLCVYFWKGNHRRGIMLVCWGGEGCPPPVPLSFASMITEGQVLKSHTQEHVLPEPFFFLFPFTLSGKKWNAGSGRGLGVGEGGGETSSSLLPGIGCNFQFQVSVL